MIAYLLALLATAAAVGARWLIDPWLGNHLELVTLYGAVAFAVWVGGVRPALVTVVLGYLLCGYLFIHPRGGFGLNDGPNIVGLVAYLSTCAILIAFAEAMRRARNRANLRRELLRVSFASIGDAVITTDPAALVNYLNPTAEALTGWKLAEAVSQPLDQVFRIVNEQTRQTVESPAPRAMRDGKVVGLANHTVLIAKDGTERPIDDSAAPIRDEQGQIAGCVLVFHDVTEKRRAELALARSERDLADFFDNAAIGLHWIGPDGIILRVNQAELDMLGYRREEYVGRHIAQFHVDQPVIEDILGRLTRGEGLRDYPARLLRKDGAIRDVLLSASVLVQEGRFLHTRGCTIDITDRKRAEEAQAHLAAVVETSDDAIVSKTLDGVIRTWNAGAERVFGYSAAEAVGQSINLIIPPEFQEEERLILSRLRRGERVEHFETVRLAKDGRRLAISLSVSPMRDQSGRVIGAAKVARDITERKRAEEALRETNARKDEFLATLAHELRNPLTPIRNAVQILLKKSFPDSEARSAQEIIDRQVRQMARLLDDLLDISRISHKKLELRRESIPLTMVVHSALEISRPLIDAARHELTVSLPPQTLHLEADPVRLAQVFGNLLNNAAKYTDPGGRIHLAAEQQGSDLVMSVRDNGIGIPPEMLPRIFDMFSQEKGVLERSQGGLGIGLSLVRGLVELHGGSIEARSAGPRQGSEFLVRLPLLIDPAGRSQSPAPQEKPGEPRPVAKRRLLIVDDRKDNVDTLAMLLQMQGHEVHTAYDGAEAVAAARERQPEVVLLDIGMPKLNGYDACRQIRQLPGGRDMVLIAVTGWGQADHRRRTEEAGFDHHLVKPVDPAELQRLLDSMSRHNAAAANP